MRRFRPSTSNAIAALGLVAALVVGIVMVRSSMRKGRRRTPVASWPVAPPLVGPVAQTPGLGAQPAHGTICPECGRSMDPASTVCPRCGWSPTTPRAQQIALRAEIAPPAEQANPAILPGPPTPTADGLLSPRQQKAAMKEFIEGHWLGLEVITLSPELAKEYLVPEGEQGVLVDEITLEAAESGILAGDMVHAIEGRATPDLERFLKATYAVRRAEKATVEVSRRGKLMTFVMTARRMDELGPAQMESAQPIIPGALSPHRDMAKPCTACHVIMKTGGQLPTDGGDIKPKAPAIRAGANRPHADRGPCRACHQILP